MIDLDFRALRGVVRKALVTAGYWKGIEQLSGAFGGDFWITGGWVRSAALKESGYFGDVDILTEYRPTEIYSILEKFGWKFSIGARGNARIPLRDGNYIDVSSTLSYCAGGAMEDTLNSFNYTVNAAAINVARSDTLFASRFQSDVCSKTMRVNSRRLLEPMAEIKLLKNADILRRCYGLRPAFDNATLTLLKKLREKVCATKSLALEQIGDRVEGELGAAISGAANVWIVRGSVRASLLGQLEYWDDIDVVVDSTSKEMLAGLHRAGLRYSINYFGNPKILCTDGGTIDLWCLPKKRSIETHLCSFVHSVDSIAWNIGKQSFVDPLRQLEAKHPLRIDFTDAFLRSRINKSASSYAVIKAMYLIVRHRFRPTERLMSAMHRPVGQNDHAKLMRYKLGEELACTRRVIGQPQLGRAIKSMGMGIELLSFANTHDRDV